MKHIFAILIAAAWLASPAFAKVIVKTEQINPANPDWKFKTIPGPSQSDVAEDAKVWMEGNQFEPSAADGSALVNGRQPADSLDLSEETFLSNANTNNGRIVIDLGRVQPVAAVTSYSWHENPPDQGSRGPQVYTLSGSVDDEHWTKIADVDTRPNKTGENWNGQHGVFISDTTGKLGDFRYLAFDVQRTRSPLQPDVVMTGTLFAEIDVHTKATLAKAGDAVVAEPVKITDAWVVFRSHLDIGYNETAADVVKKWQGPIMDRVLNNIEQTRQLPPGQRFVWSMKGWMLQQVLDSQQDPARKKRIEQAVREGSIVADAMPANLEAGTGDLEDLVRGLGFSSRIARQYGRPLPIMAKWTDVPCNTWEWPTILTHAGVKFLQIGCNDNSGHLKVPPLFWWEGPDGSRILCNFTPYYGSQPWGNFESVKPPSDWPSHNYLDMIVTGENSGPLSLARINGIRAAIEKAIPGVRVHFGTSGDFARAVLAEHPELPVVRGDMPDTWIHGFMSMPVETKISHTIRPFEPALETLDTQLRDWGIAVSNVAPDLAEAYEQSMLYAEHTFGPDGPNGHSWNSHTPRDQYGTAWGAAYKRGAYTLYEKAFDTKRNYARKEFDIVHDDLQSRLDLLAKSVNANGKRVIVYNGLPWPRSGMVNVEGKLRYVENIPANGYKTFSAEEQNSSKSDKQTSLETRFYRVTFDLKRGGIASLVEKKTGRELVDKTSTYALGQFLHEQFDEKQLKDYAMAYARPAGWGGLGGAFVKGSLPEDLKYAALTPPSWNIIVQHGDVADVATLTTTNTPGLAKNYAVVFIFPHQQPYVDAEWHVTDKTPNPLPEGGWLCFPFAVNQPQFTLGRLGGVIDPAKDIVRGANKDLICLDTGLTITGQDGTGIGLCPINSPCVSLDELGLYKYSLDYVPKHASVFVNLYNNEWHTNFPEWQDGSWTSRVRWWPTENHSSLAQSLVIPAWEARLPLLAVVADGPAGKLPKKQAGVSVSRPGVLVTAFGGNPDGNGTLLRVWDQSGQNGKLTVTLPGSFQTATPVNLRGEVLGDPLQVRNGTLAFYLHAFAPASYVLN